MSVVATGRRQLELPLLEPAPLWEVLDERRRGPQAHARFVRIAPGRVLNAPASTGMDFWSVNPYVGCEFGCAYCYARDTHRWTVERAGAAARDGLSADDDFERRILVKEGAAEALARSLTPARAPGTSLVIGTATDPYQPAERRFGLTRRILELLLRYEGLTIGLITKSPLVTRDRDLLRALAERHDVSVNISLAGMDARLLRRLEPRTPVPAARLRALSRLRAAGVHAGLLVAPIVPGLTDGRRALARLLAAARAADAAYVVGHALRLGAAARRRFLPHLEREFPELAARYRAHYDGRTGASRAYRDALRTRLTELQLAYGFPVAEGMKRERQLAGASGGSAAGHVEGQGALFADA